MLSSRRSLKLVQIIITQQSLCTWALTQTGLPLGPDVTPIREGEVASFASLKELRARLSPMLDYCEKIDQRNAKEVVELDKVIANENLPESVRESAKLELAKYKQKPVAAEAGAN